jgi:type IV pilus assembly protein PilM
MSLVSTLFRPSRPSVAVDVGASRVVAVRLGAGSPPAASYAVEPLPSGAIVPGLLTPNIVDEKTVEQAVSRALDAVGRPRRLALLVPDAVAKVSLIRFEKVPTSGHDLEALIRWQMRKSVPFRMDEAQVTWAEGQSLEAGGREFVVAVAQREIIAQYEQVVSRGGSHVGLVDLATFNLVNLVLAQDAPDDWLLVHVAADSTTLAIVRRGQVIFYRQRGVDAEESLEDLVHQSRMYYEDRLSGRGFGRVVFSGAASGPDGVAGADRLRRLLADLLQAKVDAIDFGRSATLTDRISASAALVDQLAPLVGILSREPAA